MMEMMFDAEANYLEVFFEKAENYGEEIEAGITVFRAERDDHVVGYGFEDAELALSFQDFNSIQKLALLLFTTRRQLGVTQQQMAYDLNIDIRQYQRFESGNVNTTLKKIDEIKSKLPTVDFSVILRDRKSA